MAELSKLRCLVIGGGGFIGTNLCRSLNGKVETLRAFGRKKSFPSAMHNVEWITGEFSDLPSIEIALSDIDLVYHLATATTPASSNADTISDVQFNVISTLHLLEACRNSSVKRVIYVSSGGAVYGIPQIVPTPETAPTSPISAYGISKLSVEKYLALYEYLYGIEYRVLRVANPYGPYQTTTKNQGVIATFIDRALKEQPVDVWGDGSVTKDYIYIDDVISALCLAATHEGDSRVFNIGSGRGYTIRQIIAEIENTIGTTLGVNFRDAKKADVPLSILDIQLAEKDLGWIPSVDLATGITKTYNWAKK